MNKTELVEVVSSKAEITKTEAQKVVTATLDAIIDGLVSDGKVILPGFGTFETRARSARSCSRSSSCHYCRRSSKGWSGRTRTG